MRLAVYKHCPPDGGRESRFAVCQHGPNGRASSAFACRTYLDSCPTLPPYNSPAISAFHFSTLASCAMMAISFLWTPHVRFGSNQEQQAALQSGS